MQITTTKFTSGPWFAGQSPNQRDNHPKQRSIGLSLEDDGGVFGYRLHPNDDDGSYLNLSGYCSEADGHLIAAAPELYEALVEMLAASQPQRSDQPGFVYIGEAQEKATVALAKARGEVVS